MVREMENLPGRNLSIEWWKSGKSEKKYFDH